MTNSIDNNEAKDVYGTVDYVLDSQGSAVGVYGYRGKGLVTPATGSAWDNEFHRLGVFGQYVYGSLNLTGAVTTGREQITAAGARTKNFGGLAEVDYSLNDKVAVFGRYDYFDPDRDRDDDHLNGPVLGATYRFMELGRASFEFHKQGRKPVADAHLLVRQSSPAGTRSSNVVPDDELATSTVPPWRSAIALTMERPRPLPCADVLRAVSTL